MSVSLRRTATLATTALLLTGCAGAGRDDGGDHGELQVVAGFYPLAWTAERVGGDRVSVSSLTPPGAEAHDLELAPRDVGTIADADLLVHLAGFQPAVDEAASEAGNAAWDAGAAADLLPLAHEEQEDEHAEEEHGHDGDADPHFWLDPLRLAAVGDGLAERLAEVDPEGADTYAQNAAALRRDLEALDAELQEVLADCRIDVLVTAHDAFGYLGDRYGFEVVGISGVSPSAEPESAALAEIADLVEDRGVTTVYTETLVDPAVAETVAAEAGVDTAVLDPVEGLTDESPGEDYLAVMRANGATLQQGQSCS